MYDLKNRKIFEILQNDGRISNACSVGSRNVIFRYMRNKIINNNIYFEYNINYKDKLC